MTWLGTNSGRQIDLVHPDPDQIVLGDIACGLENVCRFNGQIKYHYSIAEHSLAVAALVPQEHKLAALLHDATEAYICDIPTPLKHMLGHAYRDIEGRLAEAIGAKFGVNLTELPECVKIADRRMVIAERDFLVDVPQRWAPEYENVERLPNWEPGWYLGGDWMSAVRNVMRGETIGERHTGNSPAEQAGL